jgi:hypothetical protein
MIPTLPFQTLQFLTRRPTPFVAVFILLPGIASASV